MKPWHSEAEKEAKHVLWDQNQICETETDTEPSLVKRINP